MCGRDAALGPGRVQLLELIGETGSLRAAAGAFGTNSWVVTGAVLVVTEVGAPNNQVFDPGVGTFEIRWIVSDAWMEGTGKPMTPTTDGVAYQDLSSALNPAADMWLGQFTVCGWRTESAEVLPAAGFAVKRHADCTIPAPSSQYAIKTLSRAYQDISTTTARLSQATATSAKSGGSQGLVKPVGSCTALVAAVA